MSAVSLRIRGDLRRRWRAWLGLAILIGLGAGSTMALAESARATRDAYPRFSDAQRAADIVVTGRSGFGLVGAVDLDQVEALPAVVGGARAYVALPFVGRLDDGRRIDTADLLPVAATDGRLGRDIEQWKMLEGRRAAPDRTDEAVASFDLADRLHVGVGSTITFRFYDAASFGQTAARLVATWPERLAGRHETAPADLAGADGPEVTVTIVGIEASPAEFPPLNTDLAPVLHLTPAFAARYRPAIVGSDLAYLRLRPHADLAALQNDLEDLSGGQPVSFVLSRPSQMEKVERTLDVEANVLAVVAAVVGLAAAIAIAQALARQTAVERADHAALRALGMNNAQISACVAVRAVVVAAAGVVLACVVATFAAPAALLPLARHARLDAGPSVDAMVLAAGALAVMLLAVGVAFWTTRPARLYPPDHGERAHARGPGVTRPLTAGLGIQFALRRFDSPALGAVLGVAASTAILVGAFTFTGNLERQLADRDRYGWNWDQKVGAPGLPDVASVLAPALTRDPGIASVAVGTVTAVHLDGVRADVLAVDQLKGGVAPTIVAGRVPEAADEIALGARTRRHVGVALGDRLKAVIGDVEARDYRVVGEAVFPEFGDSGQLETGALMTFRELQRVLPSAPRNVYLLRFDGSRPVGAERALVADAVVPYPTRDDARPQDLVDLAGGDGQLGLLVVALTLLAFVVLLHALITATRRAQRDFAVLRGLGLCRPQVWSTVGWQVTTIVAGALAVGVPGGLLVGQLAWRRFARSLGIASNPAIPVGSLALILAGVLVVSALAALVPAYLASRARPARILRTA